MGRLYKTMNPPRQITCVDCDDGKRYNCCGCLRYQIVTLAEKLGRDTEEQLVQILAEVIKKREANNYGKEDISCLQEMRTKTENR